MCIFHKFTHNFKQDESDVFLTVRQKGHQYSRLPDHWWMYGDLGKATATFLSLSIKENVKWGINIFYRTHGTSTLK